SIIDEDASLTIADRPMNECRCYRRVNTAGQSTDHALISADSCSNPRDLFFDGCSRGPISSALANLEQEIPQDMRAHRRVRYLRMKLHAVNFARRIFKGIHALIRSRGHMETVRQTRDAIAMTQPNIHLFRQRRKQPSCIIHDRESAITVAP